MSTTLAAKASTKVDDIAGFSSALKAQLKAAFSNSTLFKTMIDTNPDAIVDVFKRIDDVDLKKIGDSLDASSATKLKRRLQIRVICHYRLKCSPMVLPLGQLSR